MCDGERKRGQGKFDFKKGRKEVELWKAANFRHVRKIVVRTIPTPDVTQRFENMARRLPKWMIDMENAPLSDRQYPLCPSLEGISVGVNVLSSHIPFKMWTFNKNMIMDVDRVALWSLAGGLAGATDQKSVDICLDMPTSHFPGIKSDILCRDILGAGFHYPYITVHNHTDLLDYDYDARSFRLTNMIKGER